MKREINYERIEAITCGIIDQRYGECLVGTHHAVLDGRTLCGQSAAPRETRSTLWFSLAPLPKHLADESITCHTCRRAMGLSKRHGDSCATL